MQITVSDAASEALRRAMAERKAPDAPVGVRVGVRGACGCGNAHFGMALDDERDGDTVFKVNDLTFLVDADAVPYLDGAEIDYSDEVFGRGFRIRSPHRGNGCGCGH